MRYLCGGLGRNLSVCGQAVGNLCIRLVLSNKDARGISY